MEESQVNLIIAQIREEYGAEPEFLWPERYPTYCIFRHSNNKKWFALVGDVSGKSLGMDSNEKVDIINLKFDNGQALDFAENTPGVFPAYHMNKQHWITIALNGTAGRGGNGSSKEKLFTDRLVTGSCFYLCYFGSIFWLGFNGLARYAINRTRLAGA